MPIFDPMATSLIKQFGTVPVNMHALKSAFKPRHKESWSPMSKIAFLQRNGTLVRLRRDLYLCLPEEGVGTYSRELVANHLLHPSYVSYETVLSRAGVIPERVTLLKSSCMKRGKVFDNATGRYEYIQVPEAYFPIGLTRQKTEEGYFYLTATAEKALCDLIVSSSNLRIQSIKTMRSYLEEYLRADWDMISEMNLSIIRACAEKTNKKKNELNFLERTICRERV